MQFTDLIFLFVFLPALMIIYYLVKQYRELVLLVFSLFFYACGSPDFFMLLLFAMTIDVGIGSLIVTTKKYQGGGITISKVLLSFGIVFNLCILGYYKYSDFVIVNLNRLVGTGFSERNLLLPLGLSFFTFKGISYLVDVYKGTIEQIDYLHSFTYLSFFGQIQSGPIAKYNTFDNAINIPKTDIYGGIVRFMVGFSKKVVLADVLSNVTVEIFDKTSVLSPSLAWLGSICYSLQLYYDFSGYSDMAIGISNMFGYECPENFNYPYITKSVSEFWRRWHITLGAWFRNYIYIPMGGNRVGKYRLCFNLFVVWMLTGIWHGAGWTFIAWGFGYFVLITFEKLTKIPERLPNRFSKAIYRVLTLLFVNFQWVLFRSNGFSQGILYIKSMFGLCEGDCSIPSARAIFLFRDYAFFIIIALIFAVPIVQRVEMICGKDKRTKAVYNVLSTCFVIGVFTVALSFIVSGQNSPFLYGNF